MTEFVAIVLSVATFGTGLWLASAPVRRYLRDLGPGVFGGVLILAAVVLITSHKWTSAAVEVWGNRLELQQAEATISQLQSRLELYQTELASIQDGISEAEALKSVAVKAALDEFDWQTVNATEDAMDFLSTLERQGLTVVPNSVAARINDAAAQPSVRSIYVGPSRADKIMQMSPGGADTMPFDFEETSPDKSEDRSRLNDARDAVVGPTFAN